MDKISIYDWFDPNNIDHIIAYNTLCATGTWPKGFIPEYVTLSPTWHIELAAKLAYRWVEYMLTMRKEN
jgi:hypothetical protein